MLANAAAGLEKLQQDFPRPKPFVAKAQKRKPGALPTVWPPAERERFLAAVQKHGTNNWEAVLRDLPGKSVKQCQKFLSRCRSAGLIPRSQRLSSMYLFK